MNIYVITLLLFGLFFVGLVIGHPIAFAIGGAATVFTLIFWGPAALNTIAAIAFSRGNDFILLAIPLFIFLGSLLLYSGIAEDLYEAMYRWGGQLRGGLAIGTTLICTIFAAMAGNVGAGTVAMGLVALPSMTKHKYDMGLAMGIVQAGGTLGVLIPPSVLMILYCSLSQDSVGRMFAGGVFSGLVLSALFIIYIVIACHFRPELGPGLPRELQVGFKTKIRYLKSLVIPGMVILFVLGSIFGGVATPTEAAALGVIGVIIGGLVNRKLNWQGFKKAMVESVRLNGMVMWILIASACFTSAYVALGGKEIATQALVGMPAGRWGVFVVSQIIFLLLGTVMDPSAIILICTPLFVPILKSLGFDSLWFGVLFIINMMIGYMTPPFGYSLFYVRAIVPKGTAMGQIYRSVLPFIGVMLIGMGIMVAFPQIILWLPTKIFG